MNREQILDEAKRIVTGQREQDYGSPEDNFSRVAKLWTAYTDHKFTPEDVAVCMGLVKMARIKAGNKADNFVDLAGYAACAGEIATGKSEDPKHFQPVMASTDLADAVANGTLILREGKK